MWNPSGTSSDNRSPGSAFANLASEASEGTCGVPPAGNHDSQVDTDTPAFAALTLCGMHRASSCRRTVVSASRMIVVSSHMIALTFPCRSTGMGGKMIGREGAGVGVSAALDRIERALERHRWNVLAPLVGT